MAPVDVRAGGYLAGRRESLRLRARWSPHSALPVRSAAWAVLSSASQVAWSVQDDDPRAGYSETMAPLYWNGNVYVGISGAEYEIRGHVTAYDAASGTRMWRFNTIPGPGDPGYETWPQGTDIWQFGGGSMWQTPALDPDLGLVRVTRFACAIGVHTGAMSVEDAAARFTTDAFLHGPAALSEARRATFDPTYGRYTWGKLTILDLREQAKQQWGEGFTLQRFHAAMLALGSPPLGLLGTAVVRG